MTKIEPPIIRPLVPATDADIALWEEIARKDPTIASTSAFMSLIARIKVEREKTIRECIAAISAHESQNEYDDQGLDTAVTILDQLLVKARQGEKP